MLLAASLQADGGFMPYFDVERTEYGIVVILNKWYNGAK